jgi:TctA family transporter
MNINLLNLKQTWRNKMKNTLINKKIVAVIAGSVMSLSAVSFSTGIVVVGATMIAPTEAYARDKKVDRKVRKAERQKKKAIRAENKAKKHWGKAMAAADAAAKHLGLDTNNSQKPQENGGSPIEGGNGPTVLK